MNLLVSGKGRICYAWPHPKMLLIMKLTAVLLLAASLQVYSRGLSQKVTLSVSNASLEQVFAKIKNQTGYSFVVSGNLLAGTHPVSLSVKDRPLEEVLANCLRDQSLKYTITDKIIVISAAEAAAKALAAYAAPQQVVITGVVSSAAGKPMEGVTVQLKGTDTKTMTDINGRYSIRIPEAKGTLVFSYIGYAVAEMPIGSATEINAVLKEQGNDLNDIIIVGYGTQKKTDVTGAVTVVSGKVMESRPVTNAMAALQGTAPGLVITRTSGQPGKESYSAQIRGTSSVNGSSVLILVDGVEQTSISSLNPNDIESVSVLKDASAAAIYGARAAGGVMLVTTKKGRAGKLTVSYSGLYTLNKPINMPKRLHSWEEAQMQNEANVNAGQTAGYTDQQIEWMKDPNVEYVVNPSTGQYNWYYDFNQVPYMTRKLTNQQNHSLSLNGGDEKTQYLFSLGYMGQNGFFKVGPDQFNRYNARFNLNTKLTKWLSLDARLGYVKRKTKSPSMDVGGGSGILYNLYIIRSLYPIYMPGTTDKYADGGSLAYPNLKDGGVKDERADAINGVFTLQTNSLVKGLQLKAIYAPAIESYNFNQTLRTVPLWQVSGITNNVNPTNAYYVTKNNTYRNNYQLLADYNLDIAADHHFHVLGGYQFEDFRMTEVAATAKKLSSNDLFSLNIGDPALYSATDAVETWATQSVFGRFNYNYRQKYFIEGTMRYDGSSRLAPAYRYKLFPSVSAGWRLSQEDWFRNALPVFNEMKLRASYGLLGNSDLSGFGLYDYISLISIDRNSPYPFNNQVNYGYYNATLASPYKTWEKINTKDVGLDIGLFNNRFTFSGDYYIKQNQNMLVTVNTTAMIGIGTSQYNYAALRSQGWEIRLGWKDRIGNNFAYWVNGNLSDSKNKVTSYQGKSVLAEGVNSVVEGLPINTIWGYKATGLFSGADEVAKSAFVSNTTGAGDIRYEDMDGNNKINAGKGTLADHGDLVNIGNTTPRYNYGFDFGFSYRGFDFSAFFQGVGQRAMLINSAFMLPFVSSWRQPNQEQTDYWTPQHMDARFPRLYMGGSSNTLTSSWWVQNAAYLRLKNLQVGYTLPARWTNKAAISSARIYFSGQDLWEISKMWLKYYDPEVPTNGSTSYPFFRSFAMGLNITFK